MEGNKIREREIEEKKIFISHSTKNKEFADWLIRVFEALGCNREYIFCSSDYISGPTYNIPDEVHEAIRTSLLDVIILSDEYKASEYCQSEAGIIWFKSSAASKIIIRYPEMADDNGIGFISNDYFQCRMEDENFWYITLKRLKESLEEKNITKVKDNNRALDLLRAEFGEFNASLPILGNLNIGWRVYRDHERRNALRDVKLARSRIKEVFPHQYRDYKIFYEKHYRNIVISSSDTPGVVKVSTKVICEIINLSDNEYVETFDAQFLEEGGGHQTYQTKYFRVNGSNIECQHREETNTPYIDIIGERVTISPHSCVQIDWASSYEIDWKRFFVSKVLSLPCGFYKIEASLSMANNEELFLRKQFIPPTPRNLYNRVVPLCELMEDKEMKYFSYKQEPFPAGGGYVITLSKRDKKPRHI